MLVCLIPLLAVISEPWCPLAVSGEPVSSAIVGSISGPLKKRNFDHSALILDSSKLFISYNYSAA